VAGCLPRKGEALNSIPSIAKIIIISYFLERVSHFCLGGPQTWVLLPIASHKAGMTAGAIMPSLLVEVGSC
jgi:hypothetical protein